MESPNFVMLSNHQNILLNKYDDSVLNNISRLTNVMFDKQKPSWTKGVIKKEIFEDESQNINFGYPKIIETTHMNIE